MKTRSRLPMLVLLAAAALGRGTPAGADHQAVRQELQAARQGVRQELDGIYRQYLRALQQKESTALRRWVKRYLAPEFSQRSLTGKRERRPQLLAALQGGQASWHPARTVSGTMSELAVQGQRATVRFTAKDISIIRDPQGQSHQIVTISHCRDTWVKTPAGWQQWRSEALGGKRLRDGKTVMELPVVRHPAGQTGAAG